MNTHHTTFCRRFIQGLIIALVLPVGLLAQTWTWTGATSANWNTATNWSPATIPTSSSTTDLIFNTSPFVSVNNNIGTFFNLRSLTLNSGLPAFFTITGNQLRFTSAASTITNNHFQSIISAAIRLDQNLSVNGTGSLLQINGLVSELGGARSINFSGSGYLRFTNTANSFTGGLTASNGFLQATSLSADINIAATGNSVFGAGTISTTGTAGLDLVANSIGVSDDITIARNLSLAGSGLITLQAHNNLTLSSQWNNLGSTAAANIILTPDADNSGAGVGNYNNAGFNFVNFGGQISFGGPISSVATGSNFAINVNQTAGNNVDVRYETMNTANGWAISSSNMKIYSGRITRTTAGVAALNFNLDNGAGVYLYQGTYPTTVDLNFYGQPIFSAVIGGGSLSTETARLGFASGITYSISNVIDFYDVWTVSGIFDTANGASNAAATINGNIRLNTNSFVSFQGIGRNVSPAPAFNIGSSSANTFTIGNGAAAYMDLRFRTDTESNFIGQLNLRSTTTIEGGGSLYFTRTQTSIGGTSNIYVQSDIIGQGGTAGGGEANIVFENSIGGVLSASSTLLSNQILFDPNLNLRVQGSGVTGLQVTGLKANVDGLVTSARLQTRLLPVGSPTSDQGTFTIAYTDTSASRIFTNNDAPQVASYIKLGFAAGSLSSNTTYQLNAVGGTGGSALSNYNGLVIKEFQSGLSTNPNVKVQLLSNVTFVGGGGTAQTAFHLLGGTLQTNNGSSGYTATLGSAFLNKGTILDDSTNHNLGLLRIQGTAIKRTTDTVFLSGRIEGNTTNPTGIGLDIQQGTLSQTYSNMIGDATNMRLSGGTWATNGNSETLGTLTLSATSTLDFGGGNSIINFANSSGTAWTPGRILYLVNWSGTPYVGGGADQIYFGTNTLGLTAAQAGQIIFVNPAGWTGFFPGMLLANGEFVPVPETSSIIGAIALLSAAVLYEIRRRRKAAQAHNLTQL